MNLPRPSFALVLGCALASGCEEPEFQEPPPPPVVVEEARAEDVTVYEILSGRTEPVETVEVRARVEGVLLEIAHEEGLLVREGDLMFRIDPEPFAAARDAATAQVQAAEAEAELADITAKKLEDAYEERAVSELQALEARARHDVALQQVEVAEKNLAIRELDVQYTEITAPIGGRVEYSPYFVGSLVGGVGSSALTRIVNDSKVRVWFTMPDRVALQFLENNKARMSDLHQDEIDQIETRVERVPVGVARDIDDGFPFEGKIDYADPVLDIETGTIRARAVVENPDRRLAGGLFVRVRIETGRLDGATVIPLVAVNTDQQGKYAFVVGDGDVVERRAVTLGPITGDGVVVTDGVSVGERVVVAGQLSARPGAKVDPRPAETPQD
jgi:RND family efflux transporter MFP subunit